MENRVCAYCGKNFSEKEGWPHVEGDFNRGVLKIEHFCSEEHKYSFLLSSPKLWAKEDFYYCLYKIGVRSDFNDTLRQHSV